MAVDGKHAVWHVHRVAGEAMDHGKVIVYELGRGASVACGY